MSYLVLARKWRPQGFETITGQEHVTRTLTNAIEQDRVHHAFLFCGARGVGKTSAARVFARALNCRKGDGPTANPCGECEACREIAAGTSLDVFEIDGASNRGINEIRELRDGVAYAPQRDRYKIYIIDEVHMLTTEAFNALLKTLEEPPRHVKFIFATTEPHKIPVTILSRCQRFDFKRIPRGIMVERISEILASEGVRIDEAGLRIVARESEGSMRDALSLLDRIISFCGNEATYQQVAEVLGVADRSWLGRLVQAALAGDVSSALAVVEGAFEFGLDFRQFATDLVHYLRDVIVLKVAGDKGGLTDLSNDETQLLLEMGRERAVEDLQRLANIAIKTAERLAHANFPRLELEMAVIRMSSLRPLQPVGELVRRLEAIERHLSSGAPLPEPPPFPTTRETPARVDTTATFSVTAPSTAPPEAGPRNAQDSYTTPRGHVEISNAAMQHHAVEVAPVAEAAPVQVAAPPEPDRPNLADPVAEQPALTPAAQPAVEAAEPTMGANVIPFRPRIVPAATPSPGPAPSDEPTPAPHAMPAEASAPALATPEPPAAPETSPTPTAALPVAQPAPDEAISGSEPVATGGFDNDAWERFVDGIRSDNPALASVLDHAQVRSAFAAVIELVFAGVNSLRRARASEVSLVELLTQYADGPNAVRFVDQVADDLSDTPFRRRQARAAQAREQQRRDLETHPLVRDVVGRFGGALTHIELYKDDAPG